MKEKQIFRFFRAVFPIIFLLVSVSGLQAQTSAAKKSDSTQIDNTIRLSNFTLESERLNQRIQKLRKILKPSTKITEVDSLINKTAVEINRKKDTLLPQIEYLNQRLLKVTKAEWNTYQDKLKKYQRTLTDRSEEISKISDELTKDINTWEKHRDQLKENEISDDVFNDLNKIIDILKETRDLAHERIEEVFRKQKKLTELVLITNSVITELEVAQQQKKREYFVFDSEPIWKSTATGFHIADSTMVAQSPGTISHISSKLKERKELIKEFVVSNFVSFIFQIILLLFLFFAFYRLNIRWDNRARKLNTPIEKQTKIILSHPASAALVVGMLISAFFYTELTPTVIEIMIILIMVGTVFLLPKITIPEFRIPLLLIVSSYLLQVFEGYLGFDSGSIRILMILDAFILIGALISARQTMSKAPEKFKPVYGIFRLVSPVYIFFISLSLLANIIGMVHLSAFLIYAILNSTALGMVVFLSVKILTSIIILFIRLRKKFTIHALAAMVDITNKRIKPLLNIVGLILWLIFTLKGFDVYEPLTDWVSNLMAIQWQMGKMTVSLGGILSFLGIFTLALLLSKLAASIFQDEWMVKVLPRGVAPAVSLILRIFLIGIGLYMALSSAGVDVSSLGFMAGALGVGIGFGLQNVVLNFVAGLILAFERPINLGDTIEVDKEFGVVTNIGVRSSNIKSYSGYEAIIPNGDLISKKVINYTLSDRNRRSKIIMKTAADADPEKVIELLTETTLEHPKTLQHPPVSTYFNGYDADGNLSFTLLYWTSFSDTLATDSEIALELYKRLKEIGYQAPVPVRRIIKEEQS